MKRVLVFDVNETLLNVKALTPHFQRLFGDGEALSQWFAQLLQTAFVVTMTSNYRDFGTCARHALEVVAARRGKTIKEADREAVIAGVLSLPPHPEAAGALERLRTAGFRLATLTNSAPNALAAQLANAGLAGFFERALSVDAVRKFKPDPAVYHMAATELGVPTDQLRLIAAHNWDTTGAIRAGCRAAFVARPGMVLGPLDEQPDIIGRDLAQVADQILEVDQPA
jgi:2-haloacid dehalogenase